MAGLPLVPLILAYYIIRFNFSPTTLDAIMTHRTVHYKVVSNTIPAVTDNIVFL